MSIPESQTLLTGLVAGPLAASYNHYTSPSRFANVEKSSSSSAGWGFVLLIIFFLLIVFMSCKATYNLTDSLLQSILCFLFGGIYMYFAFLYYGFSGYKFKLSNSSSNNRN